jgi:hypothetical protein
MNAPIYGWWQCLVLVNEAELILETIGTTSQRVLQFFGDPNPTRFNFSQHLVFKGTKITLKHVQYSSSGGCRFLNGCLH